MFSNIVKKSNLNNELLIYCTQVSFHINRHKQTMQKKLRMLQVCLPLNLKIETIIDSLCYDEFQLMHQQVLNVIIDSST